MTLNRNQKTLVRILAGAFVYGAAVLYGLYGPEKGIVSPLLFLAALLVLGADVFARAVRNIARGQVFDENLLMSVATIGAFIIGEYAEGVAVMLFYQVGELFQSYAVERSRRSIAGLMDIRPDYANALRGGELDQLLVVGLQCLGLLQRAAVLVEHLPGGVIKLLDALLRSRGLG